MCLVWLWRAQSCEQWWPLAYIPHRVACSAAVSPLHLLLPVQEAQGGATARSLLPDALPLTYSAAVIVIIAA